MSTNLTKTPCGRAWPGVVLTALLFALLATPTLAQSGGDFVIARSTIDAGGSTERSPDDLLVRGTIGQPDVGHIGFGTIVLTGGFWATGERTGIFFRDGFESGDTSAWSATIGPAFFGGDPPGTESLGTESIGPEGLGPESRAGQASDLPLARAEPSTREPTSAGGAR